MLQDGQEVSERVRGEGGRKGAITGRGEGKQGKVASWATNLQTQRVEIRHVRRKHCREDGATGVER